MRLKKGLSFIWSGPLEETKMLSHILGLIAGSAVLVYCPFLSFVGSKTNLLVMTVIYVILTILVTLVVFQTTSSKHLAKIYDFISKNYCDIADHKTYIHEEGVFLCKNKER